MLVLLTAGAMLMTDLPDPPAQARSRLPAPGSQRRLAGAGAAPGCAGASLVGQRWSEDMRAPLLGAATREVRVLRVGQPRTMDLREDRLNVILDADGRVVEITCG
ncbi:I78 family peptidase inhibitor [Sphingomonas sp. DT-51]|uniref:I78 family peptidase inhibitor n=1 Tax=Sphingomonas sp. DT-51 TaxID=3396165 RepID=UPI003F1CF9FC